jgi:hypothetical protein
MIGFRLFNAGMAPKMRVRVYAAPKLDMVDKAQIEAAKSLQDAPPSVIRLAGKAANLPREMIAELIAGSMAARAAMGAVPGEEAPPEEMSGLAPGPSGAPPLALAPTGT